jgi:magnesium-transporting ATPase (P-type)
MIVTLRVLYLLLYIVLASQGIFYFLAVADACQTLPLDAFIEFRKAVERVIEMPLKCLYCSSILLALSILICQIKNVHSVLFYTVLISLGFLLADVVLAVTRSMPLNALIREYTPFSNQHSYEAIRSQWLFYINMRGMLSVSGLLILVAGFVLDTIAVEK